MANGKGAGCLKSVFLTVVVVVCGIGLFLFGAQVESQTNGGVTGLLSGSTPSAVGDQPAGGAAEQQEGDGEDAGKVLYDGDDMKVVFAGLQPIDGIDGASLMLEVENKTGQTGWVTPDQQTSEVNGYSAILTQGAPTYIKPGNKAVVALALNYQQLNVSDIGQIESVSMDLQLIAEDSASDVVASAPISIAF